MSLRIVTADQRAAENVGVKALIVGASGVGKTSLLRTLEPETTLFLDVEAGDLSVSDIAIDTVRPRTWPELRDVACWIGGPNRATDKSKPYSQAHFDYVVEMMGDPAALEKYTTLFVDSLSVASRICLAWAETQPEAFSEKTGKPDIRGAYGLLGREFTAWATHLQHTRGKHVIFLAILDHLKDDFGRMSWEIQMAGAKSGKELPGIVDQVITMANVDFGDGNLTRAFVTKFGNSHGYPAKDRSGRLDEIEEPHLGKLIAKASDQKRRRADLTTTINQPIDTASQDAAQAA